MFYYRFCEDLRMEILQQAGITETVMRELGIELVALNEQGTFERPIAFGESLQITLKLSGLSKQASR